MDEFIYKLDERDILLKKKKLLELKAKELAIKAT